MLVQTWRQAAPCLHKQAARRLVQTRHQVVPCLLGTCRLQHKLTVTRQWCPTVTVLPPQWCRVGWPLPGGALLPFLEQLPIKDLVTLQRAPHHTHSNEGQHGVQGGRMAHAALARRKEEEAAPPDLLSTLAAGVSCHSMLEAASADLEQAGSASAARVPTCLRQVLHCSGRQLAASRQAEHL